MNKKKVILLLNAETIKRLKEGPHHSAQGLEILGMEFQEAWDESEKLRKEKNRAKRKK